MSNKKKKSFCASVKDDLILQEPKKKCCAYTFTDAINALDKSREPGISASDVLDKRRCDNCLKEFLRAAFLSCGNVTDPEKEDHLDFTFHADTDYDTVKSALIEAGFEPSESSRRGKPILYFKKNEVIGDFLAYIGAQRAAFEIMNGKFMKEVRNETNRLVNCDTANIKKSVDSSKKYIEAIDFLESSGALSSLPEELKEAAALRKNNTQASLSELALMCRPEITKSGMKHRLEKLLEAYEERKEK